MYLTYIESSVFRYDIYEYVVRLLGTDFVNPKFKNLNPIFQTMGLSHFIR